METPSRKEQLSNLDAAWDLVAQANKILGTAGMGSFSYDEHPGHTRTFSYEIVSLWEKILDALNSINRARENISAYVQQKDQEDGRKNDQHR